MTVRANQYPDPILALLASQSARSIRRWISIARDNHLSLFGTGDAAKYLSEPPFDLYSKPLRVGCACSPQRVDAARQAGP